MHTCFISQIPGLFLIIIIWYYTNFTFIRGDRNFIKKKKKNIWAMKLCVYHFLHKKYIHCFISGFSVQLGHFLIRCGRLGLYCHTVWSLNIHLSKAKFWIRHCLTVKHSTILSSILCFIRFVRIKFWSVKIFKFLFSQKCCFVLKMTQSYFS